MTFARKVFVHLIIAAVMVGSLYDIATRQEHWPFSDYPMFASVHRKHALDNWYRIFGVTPDGREIAILRYDQLWPLDQSRLPLGIRYIAQTKGSEARVREALEDTLRRYEARRIAGEHGGPAIDGIRLYTLSWDLEPYAANIERPRSKTLVAEVHRQTMAVR